MADELSNNPPSPSHGHVAFVLTRATGEIEIRARDEERLWSEQTKHAGYKFGKMLRYSSTLVGVKGEKVDG